MDKIISAEYTTMSKSNNEDSAAELDSKKTIVNTGFEQSNPQDVLQKLREEFRKMHEKRSVDIAIVKKEDWL